MNKSVKFAAALLSVGCLLPGAALADTPVDLYVNYHRVIADDSMGEPYINDAGRTMVPLRVINDYLHYTTDWTQDGTIHVTDPDGKVDVTMKVDSFDYAAGGKSGTFGTAPAVRDGRTYLPARDFSELYGTIYWDASSQSVWVGDSETPIYRVEGDALVRVTKDGKQVVKMPEGQNVSVAPPDDPSMVCNAKVEKDGKTYVAIQNHAKFTGESDLFRDDGDHMTGLGLKINSTSSFAVDGSTVYSTMGTSAGGGTMSIDPKKLLISTAEGTKEMTLDFDVNACRLVMTEDGLTAIAPDGTRHHITVQ